MRAPGSRDGRLLPIAFTSSPVVREGELVGTVVAFHDINEPHYPGVRAVWESVPSEDYELLEFTAQYEERTGKVARVSRLKRRE